MNAIFGSGTVKLAPIPVAKTFSVETIYYPTPFGLHKVWAWQNVTMVDLLHRLCITCFLSDGLSLHQVESLLTPCPDLLEIMPSDVLEQIQALHKTSTGSAEQLQLPTST